MSSYTDFSLTMEAQPMIVDTGFNDIRARFRKYPVRLATFLITSLFTSAVDAYFMQAHAQQSREQCYNCCASAGYDEYFTEQCRLKCFRNPDHCVSSKGKEPVDATQPKPQTDKPLVAKPSGPPQAVSQEQPARPQPRRAEFVWPNPLNLVPGREFEAAGQILVLNGIVPQHPNYPVALRAVEAVLIDFGRNNPAGGALPTSRLESLVGQFR